MVDDLSDGDDPGLEALRALPCAVIVTSRMRSLEGFASLALSAPSAEVQRTVPDALFYDFCLYAGYFLKFWGETGLAEELFRTVLAETEHPAQKARALFYLYELGLCTGDYAASTRWGREGAAGGTAGVRTGKSDAQERLPAAFSHSPGSREPFLALYSPVGQG